MQRIIAVSTAPADIRCGCDYLICLSCRIHRRRTMRTLKTAIFALLAFTFACGPNTVREANTALTTRKDATPLMRCNVAAKRHEPLVTEWPASSKARLETLLLETLESKDSAAVAVSYAGCEMNIVDTCKPPGNYDFYKTSLHRDSIDIKDSDELYAKLPLGAVGVEGELERSGRLTMTTIIAGQLKLLPDSTKMDAVHETAGCEHATHLIMAVSLGAFALKAGENSKVGGGIKSGLFSGGKSSGHEEKLVREAGDPKACENTPPDQPARGCQVPIQLFLQPIPGAVEENVKLIESQPLAPIGPIERPKAEASTNLRFWSYILAGVGVAAGGAGALFLLQANSKANAVNSGTLSTGSDVESAKGQATTYRAIGIGGVIVGGLGLGAAVPLFLSGGGINVKGGLDVKANVKGDVKGGTK